MASISDVAKRAGVAKSTVSLVVNNNGYVSAETRKKVEEAIQELNYQPSQIGRNLSKNRTDLIGIIIPDISHPFFGTFVKYAEEALYRKGYKTLICSTVERENMEEEFLNMLKNRTMDGIIMGAHSLLQDKYMELDKPVVAFDRDLGEKIPMIMADHGEGGRIAAQLFLDAGCREVVKIGEEEVIQMPAHQYHQVFERTLLAAGIRVHYLKMPHNTFREEDFCAAAQEVFEKYSSVDGVFGADLAILACMREAHKRGIRVPEQVKMAAYDGTYLTRTGERVVTAVVQPVQELAYACAEMMDQLVKKEIQKSSHQIFPVHLQEGETI